MPERGQGETLFCPVELDGVLINISSPSPAEAEAMAQGTAAGNYGLEHVGLTTDDLDADVARLREHGLEIYVLRDSPAMRMAPVASSSAETKPTSQPRTGIGLSCSYSLAVSRCVST